MMLYALRRTSSGRQRGEFPLGKLSWDGALSIEVRDRATRETLRAYFSKPVWVLLPVGDGSRLLAHTWERLEPGDEEHFLEAARRLYQLDLYLDMKA